MKRLLSSVALLGLMGLGLNLSAQQTPSTPQQQQQTDATNSQQSARAFEGKISKAGDKLVLQETSTQTAYQLDDQDKAKQFKGKAVKVMATLDPSTNTLHVVDITPSENQ
jgi:Protein of unknown function (DUF5818)